MLNVGSCSLHTVHKAFRDSVAASGWDIEAFLSNAYYLYKDTSARRKDYMNLSFVLDISIELCGPQVGRKCSSFIRLLKILPQLKQCVKAFDEKKLKNPCA